MIRRSFIVFILLQVAACSPFQTINVSVHEVAPEECERVGWFSVKADSEESLLEKAKLRAQRSGANTIYSPSGKEVALHSKYTMEQYFRSYACPKT